MNRKLWCIGGGKGGVGKSIFTLGLGMCLSRLGKKIILLDLDLGGANLHTLMGVRYPALTLEDFFLKRVSRLEDLIIDTQIEGIGLICGADDILGAANPTYSQKVRALQQIAELPADLVLLDLGAGTSFNVLDFFNYSPGKLCILTNQATSLQNVYGFIKSALYRHISREFARDHDLLSLLQPLDPENGHEDLDSMEKVMDHIGDGERRDQLARLLQEFSVHLVVNMVKGPRDLQAPVIIQKVCESFLSIRPEVLGYLSSDPEVEQAVNRMVPFPLARQDSPAARDLGRMAALLLEKSGLVSPMNVGAQTSAPADASKPWHAHQSGAAL